MIEICKYCNVGPTELGKIGSTFKAVNVDGDSLHVQLHQAVEQRSEKVLDRLAKHLRVNLPQVKRVKYECKSPPSTRTIIV